MFYFQRPVGGLERTLKICTTWYKSSASAPDPAWPDGELAGPGENAEDLYHVVQIFSVRAGPGPGRLPRLVDNGRSERIYFRYISTSHIFDPGTMFFGRLWFYCVIPHATENNPG